MRFLDRVVGFFLRAALIVLLILGTPVAYTEVMCQGEGPVAEAAPLSGETRPEIRTLLTYPEWHIVHTYDDYAQVIATGDPHEFAFLRAIWGYWSSLCTLTQESATFGRDRFSDQTVGLCDRPVVQRRDGAEGRL